MSKGALPMFSSKSFRVSGLTFRSLIHMNPFAKQKRETCTQRTNLWMPRGRWGWGELRDWDSHIYTIDAMYKIDNS